MGKQLVLTPTIMHGGSMILKEMQSYLVDQYGCHTIILYGSYAKGSQNEKSDIDVIGFTARDLECQDKSWIQGIPLDAWIYNDSKMSSVEAFVHVRKGQVVLDAENMAHDFMGRLEALINEGPHKQTYEQKKNALDWLKKMNTRTLNDDLESYYRFHWLLTDVLPIYFDVMESWYLGSKEALEWIEKNDSEMYEILQKVYSKDVTKEHVDELILLLEQRIK